MVTIGENPIVVTQKNIIKKSKHTFTKRHQNTHTQRQQDKKTSNSESTRNNLKTMIKMAIVTPCLSIITLNITRLNSPNKRHRMAEWIKKNP